MLGAATEYVREALEIKTFQTVVRVDEKHLHMGHHVERDGAQGAGVGRYGPPREDAKSLLAGDVGEGSLDGLTRPRLGRQEGHAHGVRPLGRQFRVDDLAQERVGHLDQDPGAVTSGRVGPGRAAMVEVPEHLKTLLHDVMTCLLYTSPSP